MMTDSGSPSGSSPAPAAPIKRIGLARRRIGVSRDALFKQWETVHAPHIARVAKPLRYTVTFFDQRRDGSDPPFDGMATVWLRDRDHYERTWGRNGDPDLRADGFMDWLDRDHNPVLLTSEDVILDGAVNREQEKLVFAARRRAGVLAGDLFHIWLHQHAPSIRAALQQSSGCRRYVVSIADLANDAPYDGVAEMWWESAEMRRQFQPGADAFTALLDAESALALVGHEIVVVP